MGSDPDRRSYIGLESIQHYDLPNPSLRSLKKQLQNSSPQLCIKTTSYILQNKDGVIANCIAHHKKNARYNFLPKRRTRESFPERT